MSESACKPGSVMDSHSSGINVTIYLKRPTRTRCGSHQWVPIWSCSERGLPSPQTVASCAVRSYRTFSPLPASREILRRFPFCCTFRRLAPPRRYLALYPMEPGLSSLQHHVCTRESNAVNYRATAEPTPRRHSSGTISKVQACDHLLLAFDPARSNILFANSLLNP